nr:hypothetical protein [uncultured archaeon]
MADERRAFQGVTRLRCYPQGPRKVCELEMDGSTLRKDVGYVSIDSGETDRVGLSGGELEVDFSSPQTLIYDEAVDVLMTQKVKT